VLLVLQQSRQPFDGRGAKAPALGGQPLLEGFALQIEPFQQFPPVEHERIT
jgi:hypothetical protein